MSSARRQQLSFPVEFNIGILILFTYFLKSHRAIPVCYLPVVTPNLLLMINFIILFFNRTPNLISNESPSKRKHYSESRLSLFVTHYSINHALLLNSKPHDILRQN